MIEGEARFPGGNPLIRALTMQRSINKNGNSFLSGLVLDALNVPHGK